MAIQNIILCIVQPVGVQTQSYDIGKPGFSAPRMPSPGLGQQPQGNMYQQQTQPQQMRPNPVRSFIRFYHLFINM